jgi:hypothetical protein
METFVVRVWMPDRPGALGQVASRIGAVRGDVVGIDILERGGGRAIDELVVQLPDDSLVDLLVTEVTAVDDVAVEDVRPVIAAPHDPHLGALEAAATLIEATATDALLVALLDHVTSDFQADWAVAAALDEDQPLVAAALGEPPGPAWLRAFLDGSRSSSASSAPGSGGADGIAWAPIPSSSLTVVLGRGGRPLRVRERRRLVVLARIAGNRWSELDGRWPGAAAEQVPTSW